VKTGSGVGWIIKVKRSAWFNMVKMPAPLIFPRHTGFELLFNVRFEIRQTAPEKLGSAACFMLSIKNTV